MTDKIDKVIKDTYRYFYDDGLVEMAVGLLFLAAGLAIGAWQAAGVSTAVTILLILLMAGVAAGGIFLLQKGIQIGKETITYPRTGYVAYRKNEPNRGRWIIFWVALAVPVAGLFFPEFNRMPVVIGALFAIVLAYTGYRVGLRRFMIVSLAVLLIGFIASDQLESEVAASGATFGFSGLLLLLAGACAFWAYLRQHPEPAGEHDA